MGVFGDLNESGGIPVSDSDGSSFFVYILVRSIPMKRKRAIHGTIKSAKGFTIEYFGRKRGDSIEYQFKGVLVNKPGFVAAVGGIPDELKIKGAMRLLIPAPTFIYPAKLPRDHTERRKVLSEAFNKAVGNGKDWYTEPLIQAFKEARLSSNSEQSEAHNKDQVALSMVEVNFFSP